ncbi:YopX family protein [Lactiplantibacillus plantarum]|uniref:YopX family protein n=1 Tax=Lactiplantibacillus plantarum TaxID=1590 RepID=UPI003917471F|nr:YopX family protein [Lactiplantibacillus plantarum]
MIKFRAWDKNENQYFIVGNAGTLANLVCFDDLSMMKPDDYIWEQFTGLKDVNGRDIYVGDIVKVWSDVSELTMVPVINEIVSEDLFGRPGVFLKPAGPHLIEPCLHDSWSNQFEVIGNVHSNPELLEVDK